MDNDVVAIIGRWGSIDLAPRDGNVFFAIDRLGGAVIARGEPEGFFDDATGEQLIDLVGWMPIPDFSVTRR